MSQLGNIHLLQIFSLIPILHTLVWLREILTTKIPALDFCALGSDKDLQVLFIDTAYVLFSTLELLAS